MFNNKDVWWEIAQHLSLNGLKALRFTSRYFNFLQPAIHRARLIWTYATAKEAARICTAHGNVGGVQGDIFDFAGAILELNSGFWSSLFKDPRCSYWIRIYGTGRIFICFPYPLATCCKFISRRQMSHNAQRLQTLCDNGKFSIETSRSSISDECFVRMEIFPSPFKSDMQILHFLQDWLFSFDTNKQLRNVVFHNVPFYVPEWKFNIPSITQHPIIGPLQFGSKQIFMFGGDNNFATCSVFRLFGTWTIDEKICECSAELVKVTPDYGKQLSRQDKVQHHCTTGYRVYFDPYYRQFFVHGRLGQTESLVQFATLPSDVPATMLNKYPRQDIQTESIRVDIFIVGH